MEGTQLNNKSDVSALLWSSADKVLTNGEQITKNTNLEYIRNRLSEKENK